MSPKQNIYMPILLARQQVPNLPNRKTKESILYSPTDEEHLFYRPNKREDEAQFEEKIKKNKIKKRKKI